MDRTSDTVPLQDTMIKSVGEADTATFRKRLENFPHTFQLPDISSLKMPTLKRLEFGLRSALKVGYKTDLETARARNLLAYLLYQLKRQDEALEEVDKALALAGERNNLVSLANKAFFLWQDFQWSKARVFAQRLDRIREECSDNDFNYLTIKAKAELAFTCTKLGPGFSHEAKKRFREVILEAKVNAPEFWLWKFGFALTRRRALRGDPRTISPGAIEKTGDEQLDILNLYLEIAKKCDSANLQAKAYAEIATLLNGVWKNKSLKDKFCREAGMGRVKACNKAIELDGEDNSVLCKCAVIYRICRLTEESHKYMTKALQIRSTSTAHHHLGMIYKALATDEKTKDKPKVKGYYQQLREEMEQGIGQMSLGDSPHQVSDDRHQDDKPQLSLDRNIRISQRVVKSPPKRVTAFTRDDKFVVEALENFEQAIEISQGENTRAIYDLALLHKALGENQSALKKLREMLKKWDCLRETERINVYEQQGLVLKELAESEEDEDKKKGLIQDSESSLFQALTFASRTFSRDPFIAEVWQSCSSLLQHIRESERNEQTKLKEGSRLFLLIGNYKESLRVLADLSDIDPASADDPQYLQLHIENYMVAGQYEDVCTFLEMPCLKQIGEETLPLLPDKREIRVLAAFQVLNRGSSRAAKDHFRLAFHDAMADGQPIADIGKLSNRAASDTTLDDNISTKATSKCTPTSSSKSLDIFLLHEEESVEKAESLLFFLHSVCGLHVTSRDKAIPAGGFEYELQDFITDSHITIVLAETEDHNDKMLDLLIVLAAQSPSTVTLLAGEQARVPNLLAGHRSMRCPDVLYRYRAPPAVDEGRAQVSDDELPDAIREGQPPQPVDEGHEGAVGGVKPPKSGDEAIEETDDICPILTEAVREALDQLVRFLCKINAKAAKETQ